MEYRNIGGTGLRVSPLCLGMMSYGSPSWQPWVLEKAMARDFVSLALDNGINFFDTSDFYSYGASEEALGEATYGLVRREELVISTKVGMPMSQLPNEQGNSRKRIREGIDASLKRLKTDYVDLYLLHKWDPATPIEESIDALDDLVRAGKILYYGVSNFRTYQLARAQERARCGKTSGLAAVQLQYNLVYREEERENLPYCGENGIGVMVYSPLARGWLIGGDAKAEELTQRERTRIQQDVKGHALYGQGGDREVRARLHDVAARLGLPPGRVAMAWILARPEVSTCLVGALEPHHLTEAVAALDVKLTEADIAYLEEPYRAGALRTAGYKEIIAQQKMLAAN
ncbi:MULTISPECIES: aldo/keto reductase [Cupriavidus]|uniref:aldo/keto reductase n=1 Tax=Cupriavidus TaxID=106589 RepID=UPI00157AFE7B|nr:MULTISPECIES: aldo/keto reductase [Cupriavidus]MBB1632476.1 aldo/keto reductase [Cupriavidus sp. UME77]NUA27032.1 aldo/keto reductase [Cupriavidus basilensis]